MADAGVEVRTFAPAWARVVEITSGGCVVEMERRKERFVDGMTESSRRYSRTPCFCNPLLMQNRHVVQGILLPGLFYYGNAC